ncbi:MAG: DNA alkylation repair protein [Bacteroidales bacterium]|nr:DNA alkylation repair protein [Bacteroidales bacterium]
MSPYILPLSESFKANANEEIAKPMAKYMKGLFDYYGIKTPIRRTLGKEFHKKYGYPEAEDLEKIVKECWNLPQREYQYFAMELLVKLAKQAERDRIELYRYLIENKSWWDTVDLIATKLVGVHFIKYSELIKPVTKKWMDSGNMWLQRTSILFQLPYKKETDLNLLTKYIRQLQGSKEFFINKAIGWILREYSKTDSKWVIEYVNNNQLAPLSKREALKWLERKKLK